MSEPRRDEAHGHPAVRGIIRQLNFAPKGEVDGLILDVDGAMVQVNIPPDKAAGFADKVGQAVELTVGPEPAVAKHPRGEHPVHKLVATDRPGGPDHGPRPHHDDHDHDHDHGGPAEVRGRVERLNYAKHGEANGVVLEGGVFVHLKPDGMKRAGLRVGQEVTARGKGAASKSGPGGRVIEAEAVDGVELGHKKPR